MLDKEKEHEIGKSREDLQISCCHLGIFTVVKMIHAHTQKYTPAVSPALSGMPKKISSDIQDEFLK